jgi:hypothetical protein
VALASTLDRDLTKQLRADALGIMPELRDAAARFAGRTPNPAAARRIASTARYAPYKGTPGVAFGGARAVTGSGVPGRVLARALEFGSDGLRWSDYVETRRGRQVPVLRRSTRQFVPDAAPSGRWIYPSAEYVAPDVLADWTATVERLAVRMLNGGA